MKKLAVFSLAMVLALTPAAVMAAEEETETELSEGEVVELNWSDIEEDAAVIDADFVTFDEVAVKIWMPSILKPVELTDEEKDNGFIGYFTTDDKTSAVGVQLVDAGGLSLEDYAALVEEAGATDVQPMLINGLDCINYDIAEGDTSVVSFVTEAGEVLEFSFKPMSDEGYKMTAMFMVNSIQADEEE